jgi:hypothetical protein
VDAGAVTDEFYDTLAADYHLLFADWDAALAWQSRVLEAVLRPALGDGVWSLLDASCGIGTQALGLAMRGHRVSASDLSAASVARLRDEAARRSVALVATEVRSLAVRHRLRPAARRTSIGSRRTPERARASMGSRGQSQSRVLRRGSKDRTRPARTGRAPMLAG